MRGMAADLLRLLSVPRCVVCCSHSQHKNALKLVQAALTKHGQVPVLQALFALCTYHNGNEKEARNILKTLPPLPELDPVTFNTLVHIYKTMDDGQRTHLIPPPYFPQPPPALGSSFGFSWTLNSKIG